MNRKIDSFRSLKYLWKTDSSFVSDRKKEWKRISGLYDGSDRDKLIAVRDFFLSGESGDLQFTAQRWLLLSPWSNKNELTELLHIADAVGKTDDVANILVNNNLIRHKDRSGSNQNYWFVGKRDQIIQEALSEAKYDFERGIELDGVWFAFDFRNHVKTFEDQLFSFLINPKSTWYDSKVRFEFYKRAVEYCEENSIQLNHSEKIRKLIVLIYHFASVHSIDSNRSVAADIVNSYRLWLESGLCPRAFASFRNESRAESLIEFRRNSDTSLLGKNGITYFKKDQGYPPYFLFDKTISDLLQQLVSELKTLEVCKQVNIELAGAVDLSDEILEKFSSASGIVDNDVIPAIHIKLAPRLTFKGESEQDELSFWLDIYAFSSAKIKDTSIGRVTGYVVPRLSSHFEEFFLNLPLIHFRHSVRSSISRILGREAAIPFPVKKEVPGRVDFKYPALAEGHYPKMMDWNIQGAKLKEVDLLNTTFYAEIEECLKSLV